MTELNGAVGSSPRARTNWSKGFFRVWIVLTFTYVGIVLFFLDDGKISNIWTTKNPTFTFEYPSGGKYLADTAMDSTKIYAEITEFLKQEARRLELKGDVSGADKIRTDLIHQADEVFNVVNTQTPLIRDQHRHDGYIALLIAACILAAPPIVLLMTGLLSRWIVRDGGAAPKGRRRPTSRQSSPGRRPLQTCQRSDGRRS
jgi:hypothetical protein